MMIQNLLNPISNLPVLPSTHKPKANEILFVPLGGSGEIGMNLNLYGHNKKWLGVDFGITFGNHLTLGIDVILPDPSFLESISRHCVGFFITHAHEDHLGALAYLWDSIDVPIYATPFAHSVLKNKLNQQGIFAQNRLKKANLNQAITLKPFTIKFLTLTHSIPEPNGLIIETEAGRILHTGDWKIDPDPRIGENFDENTIIDSGIKGIDAVICDSTNALEEGWSTSEGKVYQGLYDVLKDLKQMIIVTCFASNIARLKTIFDISKKIGRVPILAGTSLLRMSQIAIETGYLKDHQLFFEAKDAQKIPRHKRLVICTGSQGESRAALARIATNQYRDIKLSAGDHVVFSSRIIPGNEHRINELTNQLTAQQIDIKHVGKHPLIHASGHPHRDELKRMYEWTKPKLAVPVHGELQHLVAHAKLALSNGVKQAIVPTNGGVYRICGHDQGAIAQVHFGRLYLDGHHFIPSSDLVFKERKQLAHHGIVIVAAAGIANFDATVHISTLGVIIEEIEKLEDFVLKQLQKLDKMPSQPLKFIENLRVKLRRLITQETGKKPKVIIEIPEIIK
ncbi:MAG: ribonuclease J [Pseudomonadota bacterium]